MKKNLLLTGLLLIAGYVYGNGETKCPSGANTCDRSAAPQVSPVERLEKMTPEEAAKEMEERWVNVCKMEALREDSEFAEFCSVDESLFAILQAEYNLQLECHKNDNCQQLIDQWKNIGIKRLQIDQKATALLVVLADRGYNFRNVMATLEMIKVQKK